MAKESDYDHVGKAGERRGEHKEPHIVAISTYLNVLILLMVLLVVTVGAAFIDFDAWTKYHHLGSGWSTVIALTIAIIKALAIVMIFMHVKYSSKLVWVFAGSAFVWLGIFFTLIFTDYVGRDAGAVYKSPQFLPSPGIQRPAQSSGNETRAVPAPVDNTAAARAS